MSIQSADPIISYFRDRLEQIAHAGNPHVARWTPYDRLMLSWLIDSQSHQEATGATPPVPSVAEWQNSLDLCYRASYAFVLSYAEWERAEDIPSRYNASNSLDADWACLLAAVETVRGLEQGHV